MIQIHKRNEDEKDERVMREKVRVEHEGSGTEG